MDEIFTSSGKKYRSCVLSRVDILKLEIDHESARKSYSDEMEQAMLYELAKRGMDIEREFTRYDDPVAQLVIFVQEVFD